MNATETTADNLPFRDISLALEARVNDLVSRLTADEKVNQMCQYQDAIPRLGIASYKHGTEAAHGIAWLGKATTFPQPAGLACTWDPALIEKVGSVIGTEARGFFARNPAINGLTLWAPTIDLQRDPRWGRVDEAWGEDPILAGKLGAALIHGIQGRHPRYLRAVASPKHFLANNNEIDRGSSSVSLDPRNLHEYYLRPFEIAFREGHAQSMMTAYNAINGVPANLNPDIIKLVRQEWGMSGFVVSDAGDVLGTVSAHRYFKTFTEAVAMSIKAGIDSITDDQAICKAAIRDALATGLLAESDLDAALRNTFRVRMRLGEFDPASSNPYAGIAEEVIACDEHATISAEAARKSIVLLKNAPAPQASGSAAAGDAAMPLLPLDPAATASIALIGPLANEVFRDWYSGSLPYAITPLDGLINAFPAARIAHVDGNERFRLRSTTSGDWVGLLAGEPTGQTDGAGSSPPLGALIKDQARASVFERCDWGWGSSTLRSAETGGKWLSTDDRSLSFSADEIGGWFTKEVFSLNATEKGCTLATWNAAPVRVDDRTGALAVGDGLGYENQGPIGIAAAVKSSAQAGLAEHFIIETVSDGIAEAVEAAKAVEVAVVVVGNHPLVNGKETVDRPDIILPDSQERLVKAVLEANPRTVLVIIGSYPISPTSLASQVPAILYLAHAGQELGSALAAVLSGASNPAGRLAMTWYQGQDQLPPFMDYDVMRGKRTYRWFDGAVLWPFGHGLSYSTFEWSNLAIKMHALAALDQPILTASLSIHNTSARAGDEVVQLYLQAQDHELPMPRRQLAAFDRIHLEAGQERTLEFAIGARELAIWDVRSDRFRIAGGNWKLLAGSSSANIRLEAAFSVTGQAIEARNPNLPCPATAWDDCADAEIIAGPADASAVRCPKQGSILVYRGFRANQQLNGFEALVGPAAGQIAIHLDSAQGPRLGLCRIAAAPDKTAPVNAWRTVTCGLDKSLDAYEEKTICLVASGIDLAWFRFLA